VTLFRRTCYEVLMDDWVNRLLLAAEKDGRSDRAISLAAGLGPNFLNELRNLNKAPTVPKVVALANELNVSLSYLFSGLDLSRENEELLRLFLSLPEPSRDTLLQLARQLAESKPAT